MNDEFGLLLVAYARNRQVFQSLEVALSAGIQNILIWVDGAKSQQVEKSQQELIREINKIKTRENKCNIEILKANRNYGAGASILSAATILFEKFQYGVILEDDLVVDVEFYDAMKNALKKIELDANYWMVTGTRLSSANQMGHWETMNYPVAWGWGTTSEKWAQIRKSLRAPHKYQSNVSRKTNLFWQVGYERAMEGKIDAWDVPLAAVMRSSAKLCLIPPVNMVTNQGFDLHAIHTKQNNWPLGLPRVILPGDLEIFIDTSHQDSNNDFYENRIYRIRFRHLFIRLYGNFIHSLRNKSAAKRKSLLTSVDEAITSIERL